MRKHYNPMPIFQLDKNFNVVQRWESASLISKTMGLYKQSIVNCCEKKCNVKSVNGFIWVYEKDIDDIDYGYYSIKNISYPKKVGQFDENFNLIKIWDSIYSIKNENFKSISAISQVCNHSRKSYKGFIWEFVNENGSPLNNSSCEKNKIRQIKKIAQYDTNDNLICVYSSIREASKITGFDRGRISKACKKEIELYKNYKWEYVN